MDHVEGLGMSPYLVYNAGYNARVTKILSSRTLRLHASAAARYTGPVLHGQCAIIGGVRLRHHSGSLLAN